jgi:hypothetical protein
MLVFKMLNRCTTMLNKKKINEIVSTFGSIHLVSIYRTQTTHENFKIIHKTFS